MDRLSTNGQMLSQVEIDKVPHSSFDMANHNFLSGKLGKLIPTRIDEVYPGDTIKGHIQAVTNFEPLVGPIMASMVTKQEAFYIPLNEVWKNADKFFSAKKGFSEPMPTVTPKQVYDAYAHFQRSAGTQRTPLVMDISAIATLLLEFRDLYIGEDDPVESDLVAKNTEIVGEFVIVYNNLLQTGDYYYVRDLVQPVLDKVQKDIVGTIGTSGFDNTETRAGIAFADILANLNPQVESTKQDWFDLYLSAFTDVLLYWTNYFFGPSSLLDYVGWPCNDNWDEYFADLFKYISENTPEFLVDIETCFSEIPLNWLKMRAVYLCWYWNYRDQLLEQDAYDPESDEFLADTPSQKEIFLLTLLRVRCWYKDTYTTALTNTGTGNFRVPIEGDPLGLNSEIGWTYYRHDQSSEEEVLLNSKDFQDAFAAGATIAKMSIGNIEYSVPMQYLTGVFDGGSSLGVFSSNTNSSSSGLSFDLFDRLRRLQKFTEKELLLGYEIDDVVYAHFMVRLSNIRMRIPELLARGREEVQINTIVNNTDIPDGQPAGDKTAVAWSNCRTSDISYYAEYWGFFISFYTVMPVQSYTGGLDRSWLKINRFDYAWPEFAQIGMDAVYNCELSAPRGEYAKAGLTDREALAVFGYQGRYYDIKSKKDETHGRLRTDLRYLTFSREWNSENPPMLNYIFVHCWPALDMFVTDDPAVDVIKQIDVYHDLDYYRAYPVPSEYLG